MSVTWSNCVPQDLLGIYTCNTMLDLILKVIPYIKHKLHIFCFLGFLSPMSSYFLTDMAAPCGLPRTLTGWNLFIAGLLGELRTNYDYNLYRWNKSLLEELKWPMLALWRKCQSVVLVYSIMHKHIPISFCHHFDFSTNATQSHSFTDLADSTFLYHCIQIFLFMWTLHLDGIQSHMKFCPCHHPHLDHGSAPICFTNISYPLILL